MEYEGIITLANSADSDDYTLYQIWTEHKTLTGNVTVNGDLYLKNNVDLNGYTLTVNGNLIQTAGVVLLNNGGELNIGGNYEISSSGYLEMYNSDCGTVNVKKDFIIKTDIAANYWHGKILIGGNFFQYNNRTTTNNFVQSGTCIEFVGSDVHEVHFDSVDSYFTDISSTDNAKFKFTGKMHGFQLNNDMTFVGDTTLHAGTLHLCGNHLTIEGDFTQNDRVDLWSGTLDIKGNYIVNGYLCNEGESLSTVNVDKKLEMNSDSLALDDITMNISSDLIQTGGGVLLNGGELNIGGNYEISSSGYLDMYYSGGGTVNVKKDFIIKTSTVANYWYGKILIGGNFYQYNNRTTTNNFVQSGTCIEFVGSGVHEVHFDSVDSYFTDISSTDNAKFKFTGKMHGFQLNNDMTFVGDTILNAGTLYLCAYHLTIEGDFTQNDRVDLWSGTLDIKGNHIVNGYLCNDGESLATVNVDKKLEMNSDSLDLDDITMNISSDLIQTGGGVLLNGGELNIGGNYEISSSGYLDMYYSGGGTVNVKKDFIIKTNTVANYWFGKILIGGNFYQYNVGTNFQQSGTKVKFVGSGVHEIHSQSANTTISDIILTNGASISFNGKLNGVSNLNSCTFSCSDQTVAKITGNTVQSVSAGYATLKIDDKSSIELTVESVVTGDANGDGKLTIADAVLLQKWLLAVPNVKLANWEACDLCKDGRLDVFDLCLLKRKLINS